MGFFELSRFTVIYACYRRRCKLPRLGEAEEEIASTYKGESFTAGFNARYFLDVLSVIDTESLSLQMETALSPCLIQEQGNASFKAVVMPVKV